MVQRVYSLLDRKLREFGPLMIERTPESMQRSLVDVAMSQPSWMPARHPADFDLFFVGLFETETGELQVSVPTLEASLVDVLAGLNPSNGEV